MSYYLGKVGRAGARLVSSCKDLYYDVNAAYLTGAVDVLVVRQSDGSLKSTPFHVRFGKLGVLRTGDLKEVEVEVNGTVVDVNMKIDETGSGYFVQPRTPSEIVLESVTATGNGATGEHVAIDIENVQKTQVSNNSPSKTDHVTKSDQSASKNLMESHDGVNKKAGSSSESHATQTDQSLSSIYHQPPITGATVDPEPWKLDTEDPCSLGSSLPETALRHSSEDSSAMREDTLRRSSEPVAVQKDARVLSSPQPPIRSPPITIQYPSPSHLPRAFDEPDLGCEADALSDSAVESERDMSVQTYGALSDTEVEVKDRLTSRLWGWSRGGQASKGEVSPAVDTSTPAADMKRRQQQQAPVDRAGFWGTLTGMLKRRKKRYSLEDGVYLDDLNDETMDPEELSKFFPSASTNESTTLPEQQNSSGLGSSPSLSPSPSHTGLDHHRNKDMHKLVSTLEDVALSLCGGLNQGNISEEAFQNSQVSFADFCSDLTLLNNPNLVVRVAGKYYNWQVAAPMIMSAVVYLKTIPDATQSKLVKTYMPRKVQTRQSFWYFWSRNKSIDDSVDGEVVKAKSEGGTPIGSPRKWMSDSGRGGDVGGGVLSSDEDQEASKVAPPRQRSLKRKKYIFTNELSSEQLASLPLKQGPNELVFSITTKFQGTTKAQCTLYLWNYTDKIVVSDIDGTITRSDVAGQVLPLLGKDWTQNGVVELFNAIHYNGYYLIYLSARAIGQAGYTKEFLRRVRRGEASLPDGPLFLAPFSLYTAFKREVIERRPEESKIETLKQIRALFPADYHPLHAGFGNKSSDVKSYVEVDIPRSRIFTVNHKGHIKYELSWTFQSSYMNLMGFVDAQFPPLACATDSAVKGQEDIAEDYSTFNYWREPLSVELPFELPELSL